jgi:hypothetical protein
MSELGRNDFVCVAQRVVSVYHLLKPMLLRLVDCASLSAMLYLSCGGGCTISLSDLGNTVQHTAYRQGIGGLVCKGWQPAESQIG